MAHRNRMRGVAACLAALVAPAVMGQPASEAGFVPIFDGKTLQGWHISEVARHGNSKAWRVEDGAIMGTQDPPKNGGILLTDKKYKDFEISVEVKPDWGCDGGIFLRSSEEGQAYQVMIDYLEGGNVGGINGEGLRPLGYDFNKGEIRLRDREWQKYWKKDEWNHIRARIEGEPAHIQVWLNGTMVLDWTDFANHLPGGAAEGMIAFQVHRSGGNWSRWKVGGRHRFRNVRVKELNR